jgi:large subunit ribosomal protein L31
MNKNIHPEVHRVTARCACGFSFLTTSTMSDLKTTICSHCHPFFTGAQKFVDTAGRIEKFEQRYKKVQKAEAQKQAVAAAQKAATSASKQEKKRSKAK